MNTVKILVVIAVCVITLFAIRLDERLFDEEYEPMTRAKVIGWAGLIAVALLYWVTPEFLNSSFIIPVMIGGGGLHNEVIMTGAAPF